VIEWYVYDEEFMAKGNPGIEKFLMGKITGNLTAPHGLV
jgi:hypothetical protein